MYHAMTALGFAAPSTYNGPLDLRGASKGTSVLILGAGMAGLVAAYELRKAGYSVKVLEYNDRAGGRAWTLRGGDEYTELGGATQRCEFDRGLYVNPGPWRIPYHHHGVLDYANRFGAYGDTLTQTVSTFEAIRKNLALLKLETKDVVKMQVFLVGDPAKDGKIDFAGFMDGYRRYSGGKEQPTLPARSTVKVAGLVNPGWLVEIEVTAIAGVAPPASSRSTAAYRPWAVTLSSARAAATMPKVAVTATLEP